MAEENKIVQLYTIKLLVWHGGDTYQSAHVFFGMYSANKNPQQLEWVGNPDKFLLTYNFTDHQDTEDLGLFDTMEEAKDVASKDWISRISKVLDLDEVDIQHLRERLYHQTKATQECALNWHERVLERIKDHLPEVTNPHGHPIDQLVSMAINNLYHIHEAGRLAWNRKMQELQAKCEDMKMRNQLLRQRPDLSIDRIPIGEKLIAENKELKSKISQLEERIERYEEAEWGEDR